MRTLTHQLEEILKSHPELESEVRKVQSSIDEMPGNHKLPPEIVPHGPTVLLLEESKQKIDRLFDLIEKSRGQVQRGLLDEDIFELALRKHQKTIEVELQKCDQYLESLRDDHAQIFRILKTL